MRIKVISCVIIVLMINTVILVAMPPKTYASSTTIEYQIGTRLNQGHIWSPWKADGDIANITGNISPTTMMIRIIAPGYHVEYQIGTRLSPGGYTWSPWMSDGDIANITSNVSPTTLMIRIIAPGYHVEYQVGSRLSPGGYTWSPWMSDGDIANITSNISPTTLMIRVIMAVQTPPNADAGPDQTVNEGDVVQFDGSSSYDTDGSIETYEWDFDSSNGLWWETGATSDSTSRTPTHIYGDDGVYVATLRVIDNEGASNIDSCNITVINVAPTIDISQKITEEWVARHNGSGNSSDFAFDIVTDSLGNVYVTGRSISSQPTLNADYGTIKYDSNGNELWIAKYNGPGNASDTALAIALDQSGNIYVTGNSQGGTPSQYGNLDFATIKYDPEGNEIWVARYNGPGNGSDFGQDITIGPNGTVYMTGQSSGDIAQGGVGSEFATIAYDSLGNELWVARYNGLGVKGGSPSAIVVDSIGYIYITGNSEGNGTERDVTTIKYDSEGNELWVARYDGPGNGNDVAYSMALDSAGNIYVTGFINGSANKGDYITIKYDPEGNELWVADYNGPGNGEDHAYSIAVDSSKNVYVTGKSRGIGTNLDYATIKYDTDGNELWVARFNGLVNHSDIAYDLALDSFENVYVTGFYQNDLYTYRTDYATIKYDPTGNELCVLTYNGPGNYDDQARSITADSSGNIYVTGISSASLVEDQNYDYATIKYSPPKSHEYNEGFPLTITATTLDPGSDDLTFIWNWSDGTPDTITTFYNDGIGAEPIYDPATNNIKSPWGTYPFSATDTVSHIYGDDGNYSVILTVQDDDGGKNSYIFNVKFSNVNPTVEIESVTMQVEIGLRVAGRKFNDVGMTLYEEGNSLGYVSIERMPGSPDDQIAWIPIGIDFSKTYSAIVTYISEDPPNIGANPVWIYIKSQNGSIKKIHHTFNVQQSKKRDSDHWNHIEPWEVDLSSHLIGLPFEITSHITDPGSDDEILTYTYGSQIVNVTYLNNPPNLDPYPSPEVNPRDIIDTTFLIYEGIGTVKLVVKDDDNIRMGIGEGSDSMSVL